MARRSEFYTTLGDGPNAISVGYSSTERNGYLGVRFVDGDGKRIEKMTDCKRKDATFHIEAAKLIVKAFAKSNPDPKTATWADALDKVEQTAPDLRPDTMVAYRNAVRVMVATLQDDGLATASPAEITSAVATRFTRVWLAGTFTRSKASDAKTYKRKPTTLAFYIRNLSAVWKQFVELGFVTDNPWKTVRKPNVDKVRKHVPTEEEVNQFFAWVRGRYPTWERLHALLELKAFSGSRSIDVCQLRSDQLRDGRVVWDASQVKQREGRAVYLPEDLFNTLRRLAGPDFLWEHFPADLAAYRPSKNRPSVEFDPKTVFWVMNNVFREYVEAHPNRPNLTPHALRRRAITVVTGQTQSVDATAQAIGLHPATARKYYLDAQKAFDSDDVFRKAAEALRPKKNA
jgi:hypothetical protein